MSNRAFLDLLNSFPPTVSTEGKVQPDLTQIVRNHRRGGCYATRKSADLVLGLCAEIERLQQRYAQDSAVTTLLRERQAHVEALRQVQVQLHEAHQQIHQLRDMVIAWRANSTPMLNYAERMQLEQSTERVLRLTDATPPQPKENP